MPAPPGTTRFADMLAGIDVMPGVGIDFAARPGAAAALVLYVAASVLPGRATCSTASCSGPSGDCAPRSRTRSTACRCATSTTQPRGELLSRVTNDIDNIAQSLQQTLSQLLTSLLTVVGVVMMMFYISPLLALIALITMPLSMLVTAQIAKRSQQQFIAAVDAHRRAQRPDRGGVHRPRARQGLRPPAGGRGAVPGQERGAVRGQLRRPVHLRDHHAGDDVHREPQLRR